MDGSFCSALDGCYQVCESLRQTAGTRLLLSKRQKPCFLMRGEGQVALFRENDIKEKQSVKSDASNSVKQVRKNAVMPSANVVLRCIQEQIFSTCTRQQRPNCTDCALNTGIINRDKSYFSRFTSCLSYFFIIHLHISVSCAL